LSRLTLLELCEAFYALRPLGNDGPLPGSPNPVGGQAGRSPAMGAPRIVDGQGPGTRLRLRTEVLAGTWEALVSGQADLALGVPANIPAPPGIELRPLGAIPFVFVVAPHHPLAGLPEPLGDDEILRHRAVAVADSAMRLQPLTLNLLPGQDVLTVSSMQAKIEAQLRCLGCGFVPEPLVREHLRHGRLVAKLVKRQRQGTGMAYAWRGGAVPQPKKAPHGLALQWWLDQLASPATRQALLERHLPQQGPAGAG
jgi:DNA-binding transcriptional LysR family regulator